MADGSFASVGDFTALLWSEAAPSSADAYWPRNFLLDTRVTGRVDSYFSRGVPTSRQGWVAHHRAYLDAKVVLHRPTGVPPAGASAEAGAVPEPFLSARRDDPFAAPAPRLALIRIEALRPIAEANLLDTEELAEQLAALSPLGQREADDNIWLFGLLDTYARLSSTRPVFAGFIADVDDLVSDEGDIDIEAIRDRFGLAYLDPALRGVPELAVAVFRYRVSDVPQAPTGGKPLLCAPSVLDGGEYAAFFPAVLDGGWGNAVSLKDESLPPVREVIHNAFQYRPEHFLTLAAIRNSPGEPLRESRARHLRWLRLLGANDALGRDTDADLDRN